MVAVLAEAVAHSGGLVAQAEQIIEGGTGLGILVVEAGDQGHIVDAVHDLVSTHGDIVESTEAHLGEQIHMLAKLHHHVHVENRHAGLVIEISYHGADGHVGRAVERKVHLPLEAQPQQAAGNGAQIVDALADGNLHSTSAGSGGTGIEIGQARQHQAVAGLGHFEPSEIKRNPLRLFNWLSGKLVGYVRHGEKLAAKRYANKEYDVAINYLEIDSPGFLLEHIKAKTYFQWIHIDVENLDDPGQYDGYLPLWSRMDHVICVSQVALDSFVRRYPGLTAKTSLLYNFYDTGDILRKGDAPYAFEGLHPALLSVGRMTEQKKYLRFLDQAILYTLAK